MSSNQNFIKNSSQWSARTYNLLSSIRIKDGKLYRDLLKKGYVIEDTIEECLDHLTTFRNKSVHDTSAISCFANIRTLGDSLHFSLEKIVFPKFFPTKEEQNRFLNQRKVLDGNNSNSELDSSTGNPLLDLQVLKDEQISDRIISKIQLALLSEQMPKDDEVIKIRKEIFVKLNLFQKLIAAPIRTKEVDVVKSQLVQLYRQYVELSKKIANDDKGNNNLETKVKLTPKENEGGNSNLDLPKENKIRSQKKVSLKSVSDQSLIDKGIINIKNDLLSTIPNTTNNDILSLYNKLVSYIIEFSKLSSANVNERNSYKAAIYTTYESYKNTINNSKEQLSNESTNVGTDAGAGTDENKNKNELDNSEDEKTFETREEREARLQEIKTRNENIGKRLNKLMSLQQHNDYQIIVQSYNNVTNPIKEQLLNVKQYIPFINEQQDLFTIRQSCVVVLKELLLEIRKMIKIFAEVFSNNPAVNEAAMSVAFTKYNTLVEAYNRFADTYNKKIGIFVSFYDILRIKAKNDKMLKSKKELNKNQQGQSYELNDFSNYTWSDIPSISASKFKPMKLLIWTK